MRKTGILLEGSSRDIRAIRGRKEPATLNPQPCPVSSVPPAPAAPILNQTVLSELNALKARDVSFGCRTGHMFSLRSYALNLWGADKVALASDIELGDMFLEAGLIPVQVTGESSPDTFYLLKKETLAAAYVISR